LIGAVCAGTSSDGRRSLRRESSAKMALKLRNWPVISLTIALAVVLTVPPLSLHAQTPGQTGPRELAPPQPEGRPRDNLSSELDRNKGVIQPPSTDPGMTIPVPPAGENSTPVIRPPSGSPEPK